MTTAIDSNEFLPPHPPDSPTAADWRRATIAQHNILLEGPAASIESALRLLAPFLPEPVTWQRGSLLALPVGNCGALVVENVAGLNGHDQARLRAWLEDTSCRTQVVSTVTYPLFPLVDCHVFDATLYYRLSVVRFFLGQA
jgi:hypothetical protein